MKKIIVTLAVLLLAAPAMATVTVTCSVTGPNEVTVSFASTEGQLVRALALDIQVDDPNVTIIDVNCVSDGYYIYPGSIQIDAGGNVTNYGTCAGAQGPNTMTSEQGSLYVGAPNAPSPGDLFILTLGGCTVEAKGGVVDVLVSENALRGGIVMEDAGAPSAVSLNGCSVDVGCVYTEPGCTCYGDVSGPLGVPDGSVSTSDMGALLGVLGAAGPPYNVCPVPAGYECMDLSGPLGVPDGCLSTADMGALLSYLGVVVGPPYVGGCMPAP